MAERKSEIETKSNLLIPADIGIIGYGIVGQALAHGFEVKSQGRDRISFYDKYKKGSQLLKKVVDQSEFIFICLPTPMKKDESGIDLSIIEENINLIAPITNNTNKIIAIKSTVTPGTTREFSKQFPNSHFGFNPEFLTEANYLQDFLNADRTVIGADDDLTRRRIAGLYSPRFPNSQIFLTDLNTAEMVKISANAILASKITMANILGRLANSIGIEWDEVKNMVAADQRIGGSHLDISSVGGWGGKCFPKDWVNLMGLCDEQNIDYEVLKAIWEDNKRNRTIHDWNEIPFAVEGNHIKSS